MRMAMEIGGLDEFQRRMGNSSLLTSELKRAERDGLDMIHDQARANAAGFSTVLPQSVQIQRDSGGLSGAVGSVAKTALSIEQGRRPGNAPSYEAIERWLTHRGTGAAQSVKGHRYLRPRKRSAAAAALHDDAVIIVDHVRQAGTKALPFIIPAGQQTAARVGRRFNDAVSAALRRYVGK